MKVKDGKFVLDKGDTKGGIKESKDQLDGGAEEGKRSAANRSSTGEAVEDDEERKAAGEDADEDGQEDDDNDNGIDDGSKEGPMDALRMGAAGGKESAFFQDSGAVPTKLENEEQEVCGIFNVEQGKMDWCGVLVLCLDGFMCLWEYSVCCGRGSCWNGPKKESCFALRKFCLHKFEETHDYYP